MLQMMRDNLRGEMTNVTKEEGVDNSNKEV